MWSTQKREALIQQGNIEHMQGRHSRTDKYKLNGQDLNTQDNQGGRRDTPGNQLTIRPGRNWVTEHMGSKKHNKTVHTPDMMPPPGRCVLAPQKHPKGRGGWELWGRLRRRTDTREGAGRQRPGRRRRREEPGKRQKGPGAGGAWRDPGHSHNGSPRWSRRREEPWRRNGR